MPKKPNYYLTPLRSRANISAFILAETTNHYSDHSCYPFCFNVKCYDFDSSFDHLLEVFRETDGDHNYTHDDNWLKAARELHEENEDNLFDWGLEDARSHFVGKNHGDTFFSLWNGTEIDVEYEFIGRSGGWLSISEFEGHKFVDTHREDWKMLFEDGLDEEKVEFSTLRKLYQLIVMLKHDLRDEAIKNEIEHGAVYSFFNNICDDLPKPKDLQRKLEFV